MRSRAIKKHSKLKHYMLTPIRILNTARDFYMKSMEDCVGKLDRGQVVASHYAPLSGFPGNVAVKSSSEEHLEQLLRTVSKRRPETNKVAGLDHLQRQRVARSQEGDMGYGGKMMLGKSTYGVRLGKIGKIDEDRPCTFEEDEILNVCRNLYPGRRIGYALKRNYAQL